MLFGVIDFDIRRERRIAIGSGGEFLGNRIGRALIGAKWIATSGQRHRGFFQRIWNIYFPESDFLVGA